MVERWAGGGERESEARHGHGRAGATEQFTFTQPGNRQVASQQLREHLTLLLSYTNHPTKQN